MPDVLLLASITDADPTAAGRCAVCGSHGGMVAASLAARAGLASVVLNDAGIGRDQAGIAGIRALGHVGIAAAAADAMTCRIGDAEDMIARGRISYANDPAVRLGVEVGSSVAEAARLLQSASSGGVLQAEAEARRDRQVDGLSDLLLLADSASLVTPEDAGRIIITGSHGGLVGGDPTRALKARAGFAVFNDAGIGIDRAGLGRLPALEAQGIPAATVSHWTARIGDAASALETGILSCINGPAAERGAEVGRPLADWSWWRG